MSAGTDESDDKASGPGENRYLFVTADYRRRPAAGPEAAAAAPPDTDAGERLAARLTARFADWYYVISAASFDKVHLRRKDLVRRKG